MSPIRSGSEFEGVSQPVSTSTYQTTSIHSNNETIIKARAILPTSRVPAGSTVQLSADGGNNWKNAEWNEEITFTNTGTDLRLRIIGAVGTSLNIENSNGKSVPIKVKYTTGG